MITDSYHLRDKTYLCGGQHMPENKIDLKKSLRELFAAREFLSHLIQNNQIKKRFDYQPYFIYCVVTDKVKNT